MRRAAFSLIALSACISTDVVTPGEPKQQEKVNPMKAYGAKSFEQRQRDCWDMPSAAACYEVGLNYELGLAVDKDPEKALDYYLKACEIGSDHEHCKAAKRVSGQKDDY